MDTSSAVAIAAPFTASFEGFRAHPYWDVNGYAIGYGNHYYSDGTPVGAYDEPIDQATGQWLLSFTLNQVASQVAAALSVPVSNNMLAALTDLGYNWGAGSVAGSILVRLINQGADPANIAAQWQVTAATSGGQPNSDLVDRRAREAQLAFSETENVIGASALLLVGVFIAGFIYFTTKKNRR